MGIGSKSAVRCSFFASGSPRRAERPRRAIAALLAALIILAGCATGQSHDETKLPATSIEDVVYYPFQVKGYQNTYPERRVSVIPVVDARDAKSLEGEAAPPPGHSLIGVTLDQQGRVVERLYGPPLDALTQDAIVRSASEAGMKAATSPLALKAALAAPTADYVVAARITHFWVTRDHLADTRFGPGAWRTQARVNLDVAIYKPPFDVAFWQGQSEGSFVDPPSLIGAGALDDAVTLYDHPGEDLSVAFTRAVAGIFKRDDLRTLISEDTLPGR